MNKVEKLEISNFKTIKSLLIDCSRVNVFIGEPNTGKSNILEALGLLNIYYTKGNFRNYIRMRDMTNLFFDDQISEQININTGIISLNLSFNDNIYYMIAKEKPLIIGNKEIWIPDEDSLKKIDVPDVVEKDFLKIAYDIKGSYNILNGDFSFISPFKFYKFEYLPSYDQPNANILKPPFGDNLYTILLTNDSAYDYVNNLVNGFGYELTLIQESKQIELYKKAGKRSIRVPYNSIADTFLRIAFYSLAIMTNKDSILIFDEPDVFTFPFYSKYLAEKIGRDDNNQYFLVTHNPYFLTSLIEKTNKDELKIFVTYFENNETKTRSFTPKEIQELTDIDSSIFFNLKNLIDKEV